MADRFDEERSLIDREIEVLRTANKLLYLSPTMAGLVGVRTSKSFPFSTQTSSWGQTIIMNNNTGDEALYGPNCYLRLAWTVPAPVGFGVGDSVSMDFGYGSIMNVIREVILNHSSGQNLEQINYTNILAAIKTRMYMSLDDQIKLTSELGYFDGATPAAGFTSQAAGGFSPTVLGGLTPTTNKVTTTTGAAAVTYVSMIPMGLLFGIFDRRDQLIPPSLIAGSIIQITFEAIANSATFTGTGAQTPATALNFFSGISFNPSVVYDTSKLYDDVTRSLLQEQSSIDGLQFTYSTYFPIQQNFNGTAVNFDFSFAASITQNISAVISSVPTGPLANNNYQGASYFDYNFKWGQYQWRIAADYKPFQPVIIPLVPTAAGSAPQTAEAYQYALGTWQTGMHAYCPVDTPTGGSNIDLAAYVNFMGLIGTTLERSPVGLQLTGVPTNNSSQLNLQATKTAAANLTNDYVTIFLYYLRVASMRGGSVVVSR